MNEIDRILRSFSPAERELWHAIGGEMPVTAERFIVTEWARLDLSRSAGDADLWRYPELERYIEREKVRKRLAKRRRAA